MSREWSVQKNDAVGIFSRTNFVPIEFLPQGQNYNSYFFTEIILLSIVENLSVARPKLKATAAHQHTDNAKPHNSRLSLQKIEEYGFIRVPQPLNSPDLATCDFFLFGYLKLQLDGKIFFDLLKGQPRIMWFGIVCVRVGSCCFQFGTSY
jgi:hypothetical protein